MQAEAERKSGVNNLGQMIMNGILIVKINQLLIKNKIMILQIC